MKSRTRIIVIAVFAALTNAWAQGQGPADERGKAHKFQVTSTTFSDGGTLPLSAVFNSCPPYPGGGNQSPELSWTDAPPRTRSFAVVAYDVVASFTHWAMYNIAPTTTELPENAGVVGSPYGTQVNNDFPSPSYDGPCPPPTFTPVVHRYVFTVFALDVVLPTLPTQGDFPPFPEAFYHALIAAGTDRHILATTSITGFFPGSN